MTEIKGAVRYAERNQCSIMNIGRLDGQQVKMLQERFTEEEWAFLMRHGGFVPLLEKASATVEEFAELGRKIIEVEGGGRKRTEG